NCDLLLLQADSFRIHAGMNVRDAFEMNDVEADFLGPMRHSLIDQRRIDITILQRSHPLGGSAYAHNLYVSFLIQTVFLENKLGHGGGRTSQRSHSDLAALQILY